MMEFGAHLPLMDFGDNPYTIDFLRSYARTAIDCGFSTLCANDHMTFSAPWLDGPTALAAVIGDSGDATLATTVALPVVRGPVQLAKTVAAIDVLSGGRMVVAVGPGSSSRDYEAVGLDFEQRWALLDEAVPALRALWTGGEPFVGREYSTSGVELLPRPARTGGPPIWMGSWGSRAGMRRTARLADGWLASAYNTTPAAFAGSLALLGDELRAAGKDPATFPNALATMWCYITNDRADADRIFRERLMTTINRPEDELRERLAVGPPEACAELLIAFAEAGVQRVLIWPIADELRQLEAFSEHVRPIVDRHT
jgi:alkanesulfonate monooxygenase SsuD/methylene tetrahydromethanopterin reductase-like flavin-dependent oxidoreductase (luciferase family)